MNGTQVVSGANWNNGVLTDVTQNVQDGTNTLAFAVTNAGSVPNPAGLIADVQIVLASGRIMDIPTDGSWLSSNQDVTGWELPGFDDSSWAAALVEASYGGGAWGGVSQPPAPYRSELPVPDGEVGSDSSAHTLTQALSGLVPATTYHYRLDATIDGYAVTGPDETFTTLPPCGVAPKGPASVTMTGKFGQVQVDLPHPSLTGLWLRQPDGQLSADSLLSDNPSPGRGGIGYSYTDVADPCYWWDDPIHEPDLLSESGAIHRSRAVRRGPER